MPSVINSDDGVSSGSAGIKTSGGNDGILVFQSNGVETARINTDKQIVTVAGTASLPAVAPTGDLNTGIYFPSADSVGFAEGGTGYKIGFRNVPPVGTKTGSYTLAVADVGKYVQVSTGGSIVIPTSTFAEGDAISIANNTTGNITITCSAPTAYIAGTNTVKTSMTLATRGIATVLFISSTVCFVSGNVT